MRFKFLFLALCLVQLSNCAKFLGQLRKDLDDRPPAYQPTVGGAWPEAGMLSGDPFAERMGPVGHLDRSPAGNAMVEPAYASMESGSWVSPEQMESNRRDLYRKSQSYTANPNLPPQVRRNYEEVRRATREDFMDTSPNEGSLWASKGQTNYFFVKNKIREPGDMVTLTVEDPLIKDIALEVKRSLTEKERQLEVEKMQQEYDQEAAKQAAERAPAKETTESADKPPSDTKVEVKAKEASFDQVDLTKILPLKTGEILMGEVLERFPNGTLKIRAVKRVNYRENPRMLQLLGIVKGTDISDSDTVASGKLYEYRLSVYR